MTLQLAFAVVTITWTLMLVTRRGRAYLRWVWRRSRHQPTSRPYTRRAGHLERHVTTSGALTPNERSVAVEKAMGQLVVNLADTVDPHRFAAAVKGTDRASQAWIMLCFQGILSHLPADHPSAMWFLQVGDDVRTHITSKVTL